MLNVNGIEGNIDYGGKADRKKINYILFMTLSVNNNEMVAFLIISFYNIIKDSCLEGGIMMDIAAASMSLASLKLGMEASTSITKKAMETAETNAAALVEMLEAVDQMTVPSDNLIDVRA